MHLDQSSSSTTTEYGRADTEALQRFKRRSSASLRLCPLCGCCLTRDGPIYSAPQEAFHLVWSMKKQYLIGDNGSTCSTCAFVTA